MKNDKNKQSDPKAPMPGNAPQAAPNDKPVKDASFKGTDPGWKSGGGKSGSAPAQKPTSHGGKPGGGKGGL